MEKWILLGWLIILSIYDIREKMVPIWMLTLGCCAVGSFCAYRLCMEQGVWLSMFLGIIPGVFLLVIGWLSQKTGYADGVVLLLIGVLRGYRECVVVLCVSLLLMSLVCVMLLLLRRVERNTKMPYIPFILAAYIIVCC